MIHRVVTGAQGFVGSMLVSRFRGASGHLLAIDRSSGDGVELMEIGDATLRIRLHQFLKGADRVELYEAAGMFSDLARIADTPPNRFQQIINGSLTASYTAAYTFAEVAVALSIPGSITLLGSVGASRSHRYKVAYDAAKAGVEALARAFALEYATKGITTRVAALGPIFASPTSLADRECSAELVALMPAGRYPSIDEVVTAIVMLGGPAFDIATGSTIPLDGGLSQQLRPPAIERAP